MKINGWILIGLALTAASMSRAVGSENPNKDVIQTIEQMEVQVERLSAEANAKATGNPSNGANPLEKFENSLWRAMALDPGPIGNVPVAEVPKALFANELNADLSKQYDEVARMNVPAEAQAEFKTYLEITKQIIDQRVARHFPVARAFAKRGTLEEAYLALVKKLPQETVSNPTLDVNGVRTSLQAVKTQVTSMIKEQKKELFANGNQFVWYAIAAVFGFFIGLAGYRINPEFFQKLLNSHVSEAATPTATTHTTGEPKLDYARWLKEFEEILTRLKSAQLTHERRIEDIVQVAEKMRHNAHSLYTDARIKNESNLEHRVSNLVREIQHQLEQGQKLQSGDRVQFNVMLEHCLRLCDGIENGNIHFDRAKLVEPPVRQAS